MTLGSTNTLMSATTSSVNVGLMQKTNLLGLSINDLEAKMVMLGLPKFRARQVAGGNMPIAKTTSPTINTRQEVGETKRTRLSPGGRDEANQSASRKLSVILT